METHSTFTAFCLLGIHVNDIGLSNLTSSFGFVVIVLIVSSLYLRLNY